MYELLKLRQDVFVLEQDCLYPDIDDLDQESIHLLMYETDKLIAYGRVLWNEEQDLPCVGRVVVDPGVRGKSHGKTLMLALNDLARQLYPGQTIYAMAQEYLERFYTELGYEREGDSFLEDDIPHIHMYLKA